jgi:glycosyltransferase involved in cell wall biosynthesis
VSTGPSSDSAAGARPRLLMFTQWFEPGYRAGGPIRSTANLVGLLGDSCDILVVTSDRDLGSEAAYPGITRDVWIGRAQSTRVMYLSPELQTAANMSRILVETRADCIYLNSMFSPRFTLMPLLQHWRRRQAGRVVIAPRGELLDGAMRYKRLKKWALLTALRLTGSARTLDFHATDEQEQEAIITRLAIPRSRVHVLPNVPEPPATDVAPIVKQPDEVSLLFLSRVTPKKNLVYLLECLRTVPADVGVRLTIAGPLEDAGYWEQCRSIVATLPDNVAVTTVGAVSHDRVRSLLEAHHCFVLPTFGENYGHAIVEALGTGRPVIVSDRTPWRGLIAMGSGWDLPLADPASFTAAIVAAARMDQGRYDLMAAAALAQAQRVACDHDLAHRYIAMFTAR